ncbi:MAG: hypothetical protein ISS25_04560 [Nanoarchaeota archaeon]|nr:hypothetical protein [DPANN group archaeon]MBL7117072.1 hypothetical protein [Nanoarchaeota archaeon]
MNKRIILSKDAKKVFLRLKNKRRITKKELTLLKAIEYKFELIKTNPFYGLKVQKKLIPKEYRIKHNIKNLYRVSLPMFWRMLYTLRENQEVEIIAFILDIHNHKEYNKRFSYKKK